MNEPSDVDDVEHVLRQTALLQIVSLRRHALERPPQRHRNSLGGNVSKHDALRDARSQQPESYEQVDRVGRQEPIPKQSQQKRIAGRRLFGASSSLPTKRSNQTKSQRQLSTSRATPNSRTVRRLPWLLVSRCERCKLRSTKLVPNRNTRPVTPQAHEFARHANLFCEACLSCMHS